MKTDGIDAVLVISCIGYVPRLPAGLPADTAEKLKSYYKMMVEGELKLVEGLFERIDRYHKPVIVKPLMIAGNPNPLPGWQTSAYTPTAARKLVPKLSPTW